MYDASEERALRLDTTRQIQQATALLPCVESVHQRHALEVWIGLSRKGAVRKSDMKPALFGSSLRYVSLIEILDEGADYRQLIEGREIIRYFKKSEGRLFSETYAPDFLVALRLFYDTILMTGTPKHRTFATTSPTQATLTFSQLVLPALDSAGDVSHFFVVFDFISAGRHAVNESLAMHSAWHRLNQKRGSDVLLGDRG